MRAPEQPTVTVLPKNREKTSRRVRLSSRRRETKGRAALTPTPSDICHDLRFPIKP